MKPIARFWLAAALPLLAALAWPIAVHAQGAPVFHIGTAVAKHVAAFARNGQVVDGSVLGITDLKIVGSGTPLCVYDTIPSSTYSLCFSASSGEGGLIAYDKLGAATPEKDLIFRINGTSYIFPGPGAGTILGPATSTVGDLVVWNNTAGTLAKNGGPAAPTYPTLAAMKAAPGNIAPLIYRAGYWVSGDAPALLYRWSASVCTIAAGAGDGGAEVKPDVGTGCWLAQFTTDDRDVRQWGAVCNNTFDDTAAFAAALARGKTITVPPQTCLLTSGLSITADGQVIRGVSQTGTVLRPVGAFNVFTFSGGGDGGGGIENMRIDATGMTSGVVLNVNAYHRANFQNLFVLNPYNFAFFQGVNLIKFSDLYISNILGDYGFFCNGPGTTRSDVIQMTNIVMSGNATAKPDGIIMDGACATLNINHVGMSAVVDHGLWLRNTVAGSFAPQFVQANDFEAEFTNNEAVRIDAGAEIKFTNSLMSTSALSYGVYINAGVYGVGIVNSTISFNCQHGIATNGGNAQGGVILSGNRIESNSWCTPNTYSGVFASSLTSGLVVTGNSIRGIHLSGLAIAAGATGVVGSGNDYTGATVPWVDNSGSANISLGPDVGSTLHQFGNVKVGLVGSIPTVQSYSPASPNVQMNVAAAGTGVVVLRNGSGFGFLVDAVASAVNYLGAAGTISGVSPALYAAGPAANIGLHLIPKGTSLVQFGGASSFTAASNCGSLAGSLGCLTIMDNAGAIRYVPYY